MRDSAVSKMFCRWRPPLVGAPPMAIPPLLGLGPTPSNRLADGWDDRPVSERRSKMADGALAPQGGSRRRFVWPLGRDELFATVFFGARRPRVQNAPVGRCRELRTWSWRDSWIPRLPGRGIDSSRPRLRHRTCYFRPRRVVVQGLARAAVAGVDVLLVGAPIGARRTRATPEYVVDLLALTHVCSLSVVVGLSLG